VHCTKVKNASNDGKREVIVEAFGGTCSVEQCIKLIEKHVSLSICCIYKRRIISASKKGELCQKHRDDYLLVKEAVKDGRGEIAAKDIGDWRDLYIEMIDIHLSLVFCCSYERCIESVSKKGMLCLDHRDECLQVKEAVKDGRGEIVAKEICGTYSLEQCMELIEKYVSHVLACCYTTDCYFHVKAKGEMCSGSEHGGVCQIRLSDTGIDPDENKKYQEMWDNKPQLVRRRRIRKRRRIRWTLRCQSRSTWKVVRGVRS
jgi:hypothetical protein